MTDAAFPRSKLTPRFEAFSQQVKHIHTTWLVWYRMFDDCDAPHENSGFKQHLIVWNAIYHALIRDVLLGLARLVDHNEMKGRDNLTIDQVWQEMAFGSRNDIRQATHQSLIAFKQGATSRNVQQIRHRVLAHNDLATSLGSEEVQSEIDAIDDAVLSLCDFQWQCELLYEGRLDDNGAPQSAIHRDQTTDREVVNEVDDFLIRYCPPRSPRAQR